MLTDLAIHAPGRPYPIGLAGVRSRNVRPNARRRHQFDSHPLLNRTKANAGHADRYENNAEPLHETEGFPVDGPGCESC
jgi:hypothetical protein